MRGVAQLPRNQFLPFLMSMTSGMRTLIRCSGLGFILPNLMCKIGIVKAENRYPLGVLICSDLTKAWARYSSLAKAVEKHKQDCTYQQTDSREYGAQL